MNLDKAEQFLKDKGLDTEKYRIKDVNGGYLPQIPIALWLTEFAEQVKNNDLLHSVSNRDAICKKCQKKMIIDMMNEQVYCDDCGDWAGGKCDNLDCKHK